MELKGFTDNVVGFIQSILNCMRASAAVQAPIVQGVFVVAIHVGVHAIMFI